MALRLAKHDQTKAFHLVEQDRTKAIRSVLFGRTVPEGRKVLGPERTGAKKLGRDAQRKQVPESEERIMGKGRRRREKSGAGKEEGDDAGKETERRWAQRKIAVPKRRRLGGGVIGREGDEGGDGAA